MGFKKKLLLLRGVCKATLISCSYNSTLCNPIVLARHGRFAFLSSSFCPVVSNFVYNVWSNTVRRVFLCLLLRTRPINIAIAVLGRMRP